jgi:hypothetical protein
MNGVGSRERRVEFDVASRRRFGLAGSWSARIGWRGDVPVEYAYEGEPGEPVPFDLDAVDRQLAVLEGDE